MNACRTLGLMVLPIVLFATLLSGCTTSPEAEQEAQPSAGGLPGIRMPEILSNRSVEPIERLMAERAADKVAVTGTVTQRAALLEGWLYQVEDSTGSLWVVSSEQAGGGPTVGAQITVEGVVRYEAIVVGEIDAGDVYLEETAYRQDAQDAVE